MIFDTHCHLNSEDLYKDIESHILEAEKAGVKGFLVVGYNKDTSLLAVKIAEKYPNCFASVGFHPTEISNLSIDDFNFVMDLAKHHKVKAIGEIGLDYHWVKNPNERELQKEYFVMQIEEANRLGLPITIHNRESTEDCLKILQNHKVNNGGIMHCFSGSEEIMNEVLKLGFYISLGGPVTFKNAVTPKLIAEVCPIDRLLVETDAPYLAPHPLRGTINLPKNIALVVEEIANLRGISKKHLQEATFNNALKILRIDEKFY